MSQLKPLPNVLSLAICSLLASPLLAADLTLYVDSSNGQLYAEPGPNRTLMGTFRSVDEVAPQTAAAPPVAEPAPTQLAALETRVVSLEERNATANTRSPFTSRFQIRGYVQTRYTSMLGGDEGINLYSDRSVGDDQSLGDQDKNFLIRRARVVLQGDIGERLSFYIQPDLASAAGTTGNVFQMRDAYSDIYLTTDRVHRIRVGQSKVPYGWENIQSSGSRIAMDRNDAFNSAVKDERDLGAFYYYTPTDIQALYGEINSAGLKHSGNYGMLGLGVYNGQGSNRGDRNDSQHVVARLNYPWKLASGQYFETGIQAYTGSYAPTTGAYRAIGDVSRTPTIANTFLSGHDDHRVGVSAIWYPQPFGLQAEWNWGSGPELDLATNSIVEEDLEGGYVMALMKIDNDLGTFFPFVKWQYYDGANKGETNAPANDVNDIEAGVEWQIGAELELTAIYHKMNRTNLVTGNRPGRLDYQQFDADALRIQLQYNY